MITLHVLIENTARPGFTPQHGLSLHITTPRHRLLFDVGQNGLFISHAGKMGLSLSQVDAMILSHGHFDHGGGIADFFAVNQRAYLYAAPGAFAPHYARRGDGTVESIGLEPALGRHRRVQFAGPRQKLDEELTLFAGVTGRELLSPAGNNMLIEREGQLAPDPFEHEQSLLITAAGSPAVLVAGCAHRGIVNIVTRARDILGRDPEIVVGGFHLSRPREGSEVDPAVVDALADRLSQFSSRFYTCHCTGRGPYERLRQRLGEQIGYLSTGERLTV